MRKTQLLQIKLVQFDSDILGELYDSVSPGIYRYAMRLLGDEQLAEDCVAETFTRLLKTIKCGEIVVEQIKPYLYRIAHNWITDFYRRHPVIEVELEESITAPDEQDLDSIVEKNADVRQLRAALCALTPDQRQVITLRYLEGWQNDEVTQALDKPSGAVKSLHHRALASLKRLLSVSVKGQFNETNE